MSIGYFVIIVVVILLVGVLGLWLFTSGDTAFVNDSLQNELQRLPIIYPRNGTRLEYQESFVVGWISHDAMSALTCMDADNLILKDNGPTTHSYLVASSTNDNIYPSTDLWHPTSLIGRFRFTFKFSNWIKQSTNIDLVRQRRVYNFETRGLYIVRETYFDGIGERDLIIVDTNKTVSDFDEIDAHAAIANFLITEAVDRFLMITLFSSFNYGWDGALKGRWNNILITPMNIQPTNATPVNASNYVQLICTSTVARAIEIEPDVWSCFRFTLYPKSQFNGVVINTRTYKDNLPYPATEPPISSYEEVSSSNWTSYSRVITPAVRTL